MKKLFAAIKAIKGTAYLVGGAVIDSIQGREIKDFDIEVFGVPYPKLQKLLTDLAIPYKEVGKSYGVLIASVGGIDMDISIPRTEAKTGEKHGDFEVTLDPYLSLPKAAKRRDLTINAIYKDMHTGELYDPYNGLEDLGNGLIKHVDKDSFQEDPLRVLRIMQILPRKGKKVAKETVQLCKEMMGTFQHLPAERLFEEFNKLLLKAEEPSLGLQFMRDCGWINHFPALSNLIGCPQHPTWHPEGDVWNHTLMVLDCAAQVRNEIPECDRLKFMYGCLLHDVGKPSTTDHELFTAHGHASEGVPIAESFMRKLTNDKDLIAGTLILVKDHMIPRQLMNSKANGGAWKKLHNRQLRNNSSLHLLGYLTRCDSAGRGGRGLIDIDETFEMCLNKFETLGDLPIEPLIRGRDLIAMGYEPSPMFGAVTTICYQLQLEGQTRKELLSRITGLADSYKSEKQN